MLLLLMKSQKIEIFELTLYHHKDTIHKYYKRKLRELPIVIRTSIFKDLLIIEYQALFPKYQVPTIYTGKQSIN